MSDIIKSIVFAAFGLVILISGILTSHDITVLVIGGLLTIVAIIFIIFDIKAKRDEAKEPKKHQMLKE